MSEEMFTLESLSNCTRGRKRRKLLGRGPSSGHGKTCCRGVKGMGARSGSKRRWGREGGGVPLHKRIPTRGFTRGMHLKRIDVINFSEIEKIYNDGETVSLETLRAKNYIKGRSHGVKVLAKGTLTKKVSFDVRGFSTSAQASTK